MQVIIYKGQPHTFWVDANGWLQHAWSTPTQVHYVENMNKYTTEKMKFDPASLVSLAVNGDWLNVRAVAVGRRVIAYDHHPESGWHPYAAVPK